MGNTPSYIKSLLMPNGKKPAGRRVWSIDLETIWLPFFTATNTMGDTAIPHDALGAPLRLAFDKDGSVKFGKNGRPTVKVVKDIAQGVQLVRENFTANLASYAHTVATEKAEEYKGQVQSAMTAGEPIRQHDKEQLDKALKARLEQALREAECKAKMEAEAKANTEAEAHTEKELVTA